MKGMLPFLLLLALPAGPAYGAGKNAIVAHTFVCNGEPTQGSGPCPGGAEPDYLIQGSDGNFYGSALYSSENPGKGGVVFSLSPAGKFTLLHAFLGGSNNLYRNGSGPVSLTEGPDGNLYGITEFGGNNGGNPQFFGYGVVFRIRKTGFGFQVIHRFCSATNCSDGSLAVGSLVLGSDGNLYGATSQGGTDGANGGFGTIFRVTASSGAYEVVFAFNGTSDAQGPSGLTRAPDGTFYGLAGEGTKLFHYTPATATMQPITLPFPFAPGCNGFGCFTTSALTFGVNGNLYGLYTIYGKGGIGLFEVQPDGSNVKLFPEYNTTPNGENSSALFLGGDGNLWISEYNFGPDPGDIVALSPSDGKVIQKLTPFGGSVGAYPTSVMQAKDGTLWGSTLTGGTVSKGHFGGGTVFSLNAGLPPL